MQNIEDELERIRKAGLWRTLRHLNSAQGARVLLDGRKVINFSSNDYLGLADDPRLKSAAIAACEKYGTGSGASRLLAGGSDLHQELETGIAAWKGAESCLLFNSGYTANTSIIPAIADENWVVYFDRLVHASIIDGIRLSGAKQAVYRHCDMSDLADKISRYGSRPGLIVTDGVFSMDGDIAPLPELSRLAGENGLILMVDDAHATGILGPDGAGTMSHFGLKTGVHLQMGTLGKALGSEGAFVACPKGFRDLLIQKARGLIFSTAISPVCVGAALQAVRIIRKDPSLSGRIREMTGRFEELLSGAGFTVPAGPVPIIPLVMGGAEQAVAMSRKLLDEGFYVPAIRPPAVPVGTSRIRMTLSLGHSWNELEMLTRKPAEISGGK